MSPSPVPTSNATVLQPSIPVAATPAATPVAVLTPAPATLLPLSFSGSYAALGDSITQASYADDPFPDQLVALDPYLTLTNLAVGGATTALLIADQLPSVQPNCTLITLDIGTTDVENGLGVTAETGQQYAASLKQILTTLRVGSPKATIVVMTLIDNFPKGSFQDAGFARLNPLIRSLDGVLLVDLDADPRLHDPANERDQVHPNEAGLRIVASDIDLGLASLKAQSR